METFYFGESSRRLFGALDKPAASTNTGIVFCPPCSEEMTTTYARLARWSKVLASKGTAVLRFHPFGTGESEGTFADFTIEGALQDTATAAKCLRERAGVSRIGFFGLRFGAFLAAHAALESSADFLVLWSPITDPRQYFREMLRTRLTAELVHLRPDHVKVTTKSMIADFEAGRSVDVLGYEFSPALYLQMTAGRPWPKNPPLPKILWLSRVAERAQLSSVPSEWTVTNGTVDLQLIPELPFWESFSSVFPQKFASASEQWLASKGLA